MQYTSNDIACHSLRIIESSDWLKLPRDLYLRISSCWPRGSYPALLPDIMLHILSSSFININCYSNLKFQTTILNTVNAEATIIPVSVGERTYIYNMCIIWLRVGTDDGIWVLNVGEDQDYHAFAGDGRLFLNNTFPFGFGAMAEPIMRSSGRTPSSSVRMS